MWQINCSFYILFIPAGALQLNITKVDDHAIITSVSVLTPSQRQYPRELTTELQCLDSCIVEPQCSATFVARDGSGNFEWCTQLIIGGATVDIGSLDDNITLDVDLWNGTSGRTKPSKSLLVIKGTVICGFRGTHIIIMWWQSGQSKMRWRASHRAGYTPVPASNRI